MLHINLFDNVSPFLLLENSLTLVEPAAETGFLLTGEEIHGHVVKQIEDVVSVINFEPTATAFVLFIKAGALYHLVFPVRNVQCDIQVPLR
jgi:hypothetical protein